MKLLYTQGALGVLNDLPVSIRKALYKQAAFLVQDLHHPSLRAKKYSESEDKWQARVNRNWRFYFKIIGDTYHHHRHYCSPQIKDVSRAASRPSADSWWLEFRCIITGRAGCLLPSVNDRVRRIGGEDRVRDALDLRAETVPRRCR